MKSLKLFVLSLITLFILGVSVSLASAQTVEDLQSQISVLLTQIQQLTLQINNLKALIASRGGSSATGSGTFIHTLSLGSTDATTGGEVSLLQKYLANDSSIYPGGLVTGYYGALTAKAVGNFQIKNSITTLDGPGYGFVGPKTRAILNGSPSESSLPSATAYLLSGPSTLAITRPPLGSGAATATVAVLPNGNVIPTPVTVYFVSGLPSGASIGSNVTCTFPCSAALPISVTSSTPAGTYPIKVRGKTNAVAADITFNLVVYAAPTGFNFSASAIDASTSRPYVGTTTVTSTITLTLLSGTSQSANITQTGFPANINGTTSSLSCNPTCTVINSIVVQSSTATGTYPILVIANAGGVIATTSYKLKINEPPEEPFAFKLSTSKNISIRRPTSTSNVSASNTVMAAWVSGPPSPVSFTQADAPAGVTLTTLTSCSPPCSRTSFVTVSASAPTGTFPITIDAQGGDAADSITYNVTITSPTDLVPPIVSLTSSATSTTIITPRTINFNASSTDNVRVARVEFYDGPNLKGADLSFPYSFTWNVTSGDIGAHAWTAKSYDSSGNSAVSGLIVFNVVGSSTNATSTTSSTQDNISPTLSITNPAANTTVSGTVTLSATASDNVGVIGVQFQMDGVPLAAVDTTAPYIFSWNSRTVANGQHTLTVTAADASQNVSAILRNITVSNANSTSTSNTAGLLPDVLPLYSGLTWGSSHSALSNDPGTGNALQGYEITGSTSFTDYTQYTNAVSSIFDYYDQKLSTLNWSLYYLGGDIGSGVWGYENGTSLVIFNSIQQANDIDQTCPCSIQLTVFTKS